MRFFLGYRNTWAEPFCRIIPLAGRMREFWVQTLVSKRGNDESQQRLWQQQEPCTLLLSNKGTKRKFLVQKLLKCPSKESVILLASHKSKPFPFLDQSLPPALRSRFCQDLFFFFPIPRSREFPLASTSNMSWTQPFSTVFHPLEMIQYSPDSEIFHWFY